MREIETFDNNHWKVSYVNISSLKAHFHDVLRCQRLIHSDFFGLGETWLETDEKMDFDGFNGYFANAGRGKGVSGFSKAEWVTTSRGIATEKHSLVMLETNDFDIVFLYFSKGFDSTCVVDILGTWINNSRPTVVMGDVNFSYEKESNPGKFRKFMEKDLKFSQLITHPTHQSGSLIDQMYVNQKMMELCVVTKTIPNYFSDHDTITLYIPKKNQ